jgi:hypothetical protein
MADPNDPRRKIASAPQAAKPTELPPVDAAKAAAAPLGTDSLKSQMPAGELGVRNLPIEVTSTASGGTSKAEDTTRAAGYVVDLTRTNEPPPGPPIAKEPSNFVGPESKTPPPTKLPAGTPPHPAGERKPAPPTPANPVRKPDREPPSPAAPTKDPAQVTPRRTK